MNIINTILDAIYGKRCIHCGVAGAYLCPPCRLSIRLAERENLDWVYSRYDYRDPLIKKIIWLIKYRYKKALITLCAHMLYEVLLEELSEKRAFENWREAILIPIPLSEKRLRERGFNQSSLLAQVLASIDTTRMLSCTDKVLIKHRETKHQAHIKNRQERLANLAGSFAIRHPEKIIGKNIILIDDVTTTGATLSEARKVLKKAGAKNIIAITLAH
ncbi:MAG: ComF family protein [Candidatus Paceibacterota bacterium]